METAITPKKESTIDVALNYLRNNISNVQETMVRFESILSTVLAQPEKPTKEEREKASTQTSLEEELVKMSREVECINDYLRQIQNRIQL